MLTVPATRYRRASPRPGLSQRLRTRAPATFPTDQEVAGHPWCERLRTNTPDCPATCHWLVVPRNYLTGPCHSAGALEGISGRRSETRVSLLKQPLGLHNPGCSFVFTAEAGDRPGLTACRRHRDVEGAIALRRYLECRDCHARQYVVSLTQCNMSNS
jgi:hypothetical protein